MGFDEVKKNVRRIAKKNADNLGYEISKQALDAIISDISSHREQINEGIVKKAHKEINIFESTEILIKEASKITKQNNRTMIYAADIKATLGIVCPAYWPFC